MIFLRISIFPDWRVCQRFDTPSYLSLQFPFGFLLVDLRCNTVDEFLHDKALLMCGSSLSFDLLKKISQLLVLHVSHLELFLCIVTNHLQP